MRIRCSKIVLSLALSILFNASTALCGDPKADKTFAQVRQQLYAEEERGGLPEDSLDTILWKLQSVPQFKAHAIAAVRQYKMMRNTYQLYARTVETIAELDEHDWSSDRDRETYNGLRHTDRTQWEEVGAIIRKYNSGVEEPYRIKVLDWPFSEE